MTVDNATQLRMLLEYNAWADRRVLGTAAAMSAEQLERAAEGVRSIRQMLAHALGTQIWWHTRWTTDAFPKEEAVATLDQMPFAEVRAAYDASHAALRAFGARLDAAEADRAETWWKDVEYEQRAPLGQIIVQVVNHGTQHRSEAALMMATMGHSTGDLDYLQYMQAATSAGGAA